MLQAQILWPRLVLLLSLAPAACSGGGSGESSLIAPLSDLQRGDDDIRTGDDDEVAGPYATEGFIVAFGYRGIVPGVNDDQHDLKLIDAAGNDPLTGEPNAPHGLTAFHLDPDDCALVISKNPDGTPAETAPCSCAFGCMVDEGLDWLAISTEKPGPLGHTFHVARFNDDLQAKVVKGVLFTGVADFHFAGRFLLYTTSQFCSGTGCQYAVNRYDLDNLAQAPQVLALIPPEGDPDWIEGDATFKGHFTPSADGHAALFLSPTIRSQRAYLLKDEDLLEVDYVCPGGFQDDHCTGTGSDFRDTDPAAISHDGGRLAYVAVVSDRLELRLPDPEGGLPEVVTLQAVEEGKDYTSNICSQVVESSWKFRHVSQILFRHTDTDSLVFVGSSECSATHAKPWTDLWSLSLDGLVDRVGEADLERLIHNPRHDGVENNVIDGFDLSPDGATIVYSATPRYGADLETDLPPESFNATKSQEIWVLKAGATRAQLTFDPQFSASRPLALPLSSLKGMGQ